MSMGVVETGMASAGGSILAYGLLSCWRHHKDRTKIFGLTMVAGKSFCEKNFNGIHQDVVFYDLDGAISTMPLRSVPHNELILQVYPKARDRVNEIKKTYKNKVIVFCSSDCDMLKFCGIKQKHTRAVLFTNSFMAQYGEQLKSKIADVEKATMELKLKYTNPKLHICVNSWDDLTDKIRCFFIDKHTK